MRLLFETKMTVTQNSKLLQITSYIISVYVPMFVKIHLNPRASEGPTNMIFLRYLLLDFRQQHTNLVDHCVKPVFLKHFCSWMNPINVTLNIHSKSPAFQAKQWKITISNFLVMLTPNNLHGSEHLSGHTSDPAVKQHLASRLTTKFFWNSIDNHNRSWREMVLCHNAWEKGFRKAEEKRQVDIRIRGFICHGSKDENERVAEKESRILKCLVFLNKVKTKSQEWKLVQQLHLSCATLHTAE